MKVLLRAPLLTTSGYGVHSRQIFEWLLQKKDVELDVECLKWGNTPWNLNPDCEDGLISEIMSRSKSLSPPYDLTFQVQLPDEWDPSLGRKNIGISAFVETDKCNPKWVENCNKMTHVIVPSTFTKNVVKRSGIITTSISVVPEWFNHDIIDNKYCEETSNIEFETNENYLMVAQLTAQSSDLDRKNILNTLSWFFEYFKDKEDVGLVLKTNMGRGTTADFIATENFVKHVIKKFRPDSLFPKVHLLHGNMSSKEIAGLFNHKQVKAYLSATRGEGYGLPLIDAAIAGIPVIATNWSGHLEFLKREKFLGIDYEMIPVPDAKIDDRIFLKDFRWAQPLKKSFFNCLQMLNENYDFHKSNSVELSKIILDNFHKSEIMKRYDKIYNGVINT